MAKPLNLGTKVEYVDEHNRIKVGVIHAVSATESADGVVTARSYQIDTGNDERVDEFAHDLRDDEAAKQINALLDKGVDPAEALERVIEKQDELPESKVVVDKVRHPVLVTVPASSVREAQAKA